MSRSFWRTKKRALAALLAVALMVPAMPIAAVAAGHATIPQGIAGYVTTGDDPATPLAGATVTVWTTAEPPAIVATTQTDGDGFYEVEVPEGQYYVQFAAEGYVTQFFDGVTELGDATVVTVAEGEVEEVRLWGQDRYGTAIAISQRSHPNGANAVVIARGDLFPDALTGASVAGLHDAPILLVRPNSIPAAVLAEINRLNPSEIYILGETQAVSAGVQLQLAGIVGAGNITRLGGDTRYDTAIEIAEHVIAGLGEAYDGTAFVARGDLFPDALAASPIMAAQGIPMFLAHPNRGLHERTKQAMNGVVDEAAFIVGGPMAVSGEVQSELEEMVGDENVDRVEGENRYETAVAVAEFAVDEYGHVWEGVGIATGERFPDALTGGPYQGSIGSVVLLTRIATLSSVTAAALEAHDHHICEAYHIFGGDLAIAPSVRASISARITPCPAVVWVDAVMVPVPAPVAVLQLEKEADPAFFTEVGDEIVYTYTLTNIGGVPLDGPFTVEDNMIDETITVDPMLTDLAVEGSAEVTASYVVSEADFDAGFVTNTATAQGFFDGEAVVSDTAEATVVLADPAVELVKEADPGFFTEADDEITFTFTLTNVGNVVLEGPFTIDDPMVGPVVAGDPTLMELAPSASTTFTADYTVTGADVEAGSIVNTATAGFFFLGAPLVSDTATATVELCLTIADILAADAEGRFTTLLQAAEIAGLDGVLDDPLAGPFTLFAPTNDAFAALEVEIGTDAWNALLADPDALADVLLYHLLAGEFYSADVIAGITAADPDLFVLETMLDDAFVWFSLVGEGAFINNAEIIDFDIVACNGVIHVIDAVLVPAPELTLEKVASTEETVTVGDEIIYTYTLANTGSWMLDGPFEVVDSVIGTIAVDPMWAELEVGASFEVTASYMVTIADVLAGSVTNDAYAAGWFDGDEVISETVTVVVPAAAEEAAVLIEHFYPDIPHHHLTIDARGLIATPTAEPLDDADVCIRLLNTGEASVDVNVELDLTEADERDAQWWFEYNGEWLDATEGFTVTLEPGVEQEFCFYVFFDTGAPYAPFDVTFDVYQALTMDLLASTTFEINLSAPGE